MGTSSAAAACESSCSSNPLLICTGQHTQLLWCPDARSREVGGQQAHREACDLLKIRFVGHRRRGCTAGSCCPFDLKSKGKVRRVITTCIPAITPHRPVIAFFFSSFSASAGGQGGGSLRWFTAHGIPRSVHHLCKVCSRKSPQTPRRPHLRHSGLLDVQRPCIQGGYASVRSLANSSCFFKLACLACIIRCWAAPGSFRINIRDFTEFKTSL